MGTKDRTASGLNAMFVLTAVFSGISWTVAVLMPGAMSLKMGIIATPIYLATHYLALALGRTIVRDRPTVERFLLSAFGAFIVYWILPFFLLLWLGLDSWKWPSTATFLAFVGTAIVLVMLMRSESSSAPIEPSQPYIPPIAGSSPPIYPVSNQTDYRPTYGQKGSETHESERESAAR
jgi:hypothetical protein